jgi:integrase
MENQVASTTTVITVYTRHTPECPKRTDRYWKRCKCRKALYICEGGKDRRVSAKTRSWEQAERLAQTERERRDPVKRKLQEIEKQEAQKISLRKEKNITVSEAADRWYSSQKFKTNETSAIYDRAARRIQAWAEDQVIEYVRDVSVDSLDEWRGLWGKDAEKTYNRIGQTSQSHFQGYLKRFFRWCVRTGFLTSDPAMSLEAIPKNNEKTQPLSPEQFEELLAAIDPFTAAATGYVSECAKELRALFLLQRWAGLRILDCLMLPRTGLVGNRLNLKTKKTGAVISNRLLPDQVVAALHDLSPDRKLVRPEYFFWGVHRKWEGLSTQWGNIIKKMNAHLNFKDEDGKPMHFHSHQLRDTYAVQLLLAGLPLEDVSKLLTHESVQVTEKHYAPWVKQRIQQLEDKAVAAMEKMGQQFTIESPAD